MDLDFNLLVTTLAEDEEGVTIQSVLKVPVYRDFLHRFLEYTLADENILFLDAVDEFKRVAAGDDDEQTNKAGELLQYSVLVFAFLFREGN